MSRAVAIGEETVLDGYGLIGVEVIDARDAETVRRAWRTVGLDVSFVLLTDAARQALGVELEAEGDRVWAVLPP